ncbi:MAG: cytochrome c-type biogenesis protein CcmH [Candidatus Korobacteraceae bacterium]
MSMLTKRHAANLHEWVRPAARRAVLVSALFVAIVATVGAGDTDARFDRLGHALMCMCGCNQVLIECNHVGCPYSDRMRNELMAAIQRGDSDNLVLQGFVQKYGNTVLSAPTTTGFNRIAWIMPFVIFTLALAGVVALVRVWKSRQTPAVAHGDATPEQFDAFRERARKETEF